MNLSGAKTLVSEFTITKRRSSLLEQVLNRSIAVLLNIPGTPYHRILRISEQLDAFIRATIAQKREQKDATDVLAALIQAHDAGDESGSGDAAPALPPLCRPQCQDLIECLNATYTQHADACLPSGSPVPACACTRHYS